MITRMSMRPRPRYPPTTHPDYVPSHRYTKSILLGLILCALGDALLVYDVYFLQGLVAFALGHCAYIFSFGFSEPLHVSVGVYVGVYMWAYLRVGVSVCERICVCFRVGTLRLHILFRFL